MAEIWCNAGTLRFYLRATKPACRIVLTNGCFDILHRGHFETLCFAAKQGDILIVAVNTDESVRAIKGPHRPINRLEDRMTMVAGIAGVDYVVPFGTAENPSVEPVVEQLRPDILVKGGDYSLDGVVGAAVVQHWGGRVVIAPKVPGASTTNILHAAGQEVLDEEQDKSSPEIRNPQSAIRNPDRPWRILLDLDGVLVDFFGGMARALGYDDAWLAQRLAECPGEYDPGKLFGIPTDLFSIFGPDWWESLPWMPDGRAILDAAIVAGGEDNICICSSPTLESSSPMGKLRWIERNIPGWSRRYDFNPDKSWLANPRTILIDDCLSQIMAFRSAGGLGILVPRRWNESHAAWSKAAFYTGYDLKQIIGDRANHEEHEGHEDGHAGS